MSYRIVYEMGGGYRKYKQRVGRGKWGLVILSVTIFACLLFYGMKTVPRDVFLPGNAQVTGQALDHMVENLGSGLTIDDVFAAFCREIVSDGKIR